MAQTFQIDDEVMELLECELFSRRMPGVSRNEALRWLVLHSNLLGKRIPPRDQTTTNTQK